MTQFHDLPVELWSAIVSYLPNRDIKTLRLVSKQSFSSVELRLQRVFLSANPLNIEVFRAIADHEKFRHKITEIVWDDARFRRGPHGDINPARGLYLPESDASDNETEESFESRRRRGELDGRGEPPDWEFYEGDFDYTYRDDEEYGGSVYQMRNSANFRGQNVPFWFKAACVTNIEELFMRRQKLNIVESWHQKFKTEKKLGSAGPSMNECWAIYRRLLRQQDDVLAWNYDEEAFLYGLERFPALNSVKVTAAAHGVPFAPTYPSAMIRAFPQGFNYPIPRGWPCSTTEEPEDVITFPWARVDERHREKYRAFRIVIRALAQQKNNVVELSLDARQLFTGINCTIFDDPCVEHDHFLEVLKKPGFRRLELPLMFGGRGPTENWKTFRNGRLRETLSNMTDLEEFSFYTAGLDGYCEWKVPHINTAPVLLESIFPVEKWPKLRHFALSRFIVSQADLITLLSKMPSTIQSVKLSFLVFVDNGNVWHTFLTELRTKIREKRLWQGRRPNLVIGCEGGFHCLGGATWYGKQVDKFLYENGEIPFYDPPRNIGKKGFGTVKDAFDPDV